jgi:hypothetical protein
MNQLVKKSIGCPYCGEHIKVLIDPADVDQHYIEDCQICCRPINFYISQYQNGELEVSVSAEDDGY